MLWAGSWKESGPLFDAPLDENPTHSSGGVLLRMLPMSSHFCLGQRVHLRVAVHDVDGPCLTVILLVS